jgi:hypothetical protein
MSPMAGVMGMPSNPLCFLPPSIALVTMFCVLMVLVDMVLEIFFSKI